MGVYVSGLPNLLEINVGTRGMPLLETDVLYLQQQYNSTGAQVGEQGLELMHSQG
jgi:hypothetical protein